MLGSDEDEPEANCGWVWTLLLLANGRLTHTSSNNKSLLVSWGHLQAAKELWQQSPSQVQDSASQETCPPLLPLYSFQGQGPTKPREKMLPPENPHSGGALTQVSG